MTAKLLCELFIESSKRVTDDMIIFVFLILKFDCSSFYKTHSRVNQHEIAKLGRTTPAHTTLKSILKVLIQLFLV